MKTRKRALVQSPETHTSSLQDSEDSYRDRSSTEETDDSAPTTPFAKKPKSSSQTISSSGSRSHRAVKGDSTGSASSSRSQQSSRVCLGECFGIQFAPENREGMVIPIAPEHGVPMAVDHDEQRLYILLTHDDGSSLHCLDLKRKMWVDSVHDVRSQHQFDTSSTGQRQPLPPCICSKLAFFQDPLTGKRFLFIIGGYIGDPRQPGKWSSYNSVRFMTILMVDISQRTWQVLNTIGAAPARLRHAVACLGNEIYVFGGRKRLPDRYWEDDYNHDNDWICSPEEILDSYSVLRFDPNTGQWTWRISEQSYPAHIKGLGFGVEALVMDSNGSHANLNTAKIFLTPGMMGDTAHCDFDFSRFCLFNPCKGTAMTWDAGDDNVNTPCYAGFHEVIPFTASPVYHRGNSDSVIFTVLGVNEDTYTFYYYRPPFNDEFRLLGDVDNTFTRKRRVGSTIKVGGPRVFVGCVAVGNKTYLLGKTREENELDTIAELSLRLDD